MCAKPESPGIYDAKCISGDVIRVELIEGKNGLLAQIPNTTFLALAHFGQIPIEDAKGVVEWVGPIEGAEE